MKKRLETPMQPGIWLQIFSLKAAAPGARDAMSTRCLAASSGYSALVRPDEICLSNSVLDQRFHDQRVSGVLIRCSSGFISV